ncbi:MAG: 16S rRNA (cytosine(967)-C(5))-methyltransferase RsmB [Gammaproteobacteria bacterium]|jgi:16S rRNA (cytosine967-C5)-methyltransferase|nr:16S rRNA (cytosine(967)-C(5))-methyltransferase RsmB [Gammaproteobacteria bacterium]MBT4494609.1 16S rRNA (cytosine(967)-C(5))-methyltransferase RsmB [Gammaproteobacteria bacterium]MBT7371457.1 16S rRNA (cytosine(967)-C(5))-methyltransferase RsmB [Gammaproteobacteria bacterium]
MNEYQQVAGILEEMLLNERHLDECFADDTKPLVQQICYGVTRHYYYLDRVIDRLLKKPLPNKHLDLHLLLMAGLYSMDHLNRPEHASVNNAVEATRFLNKDWAKGLINGVLRRYGRERDKLKREVTNNDAEAQFNHPRWLIDAIKTQLPQYDEILIANQSRAPMTLRVNLRRGSREDYMTRLADAGLSASAGRLSHAAVVLSKPVDVTQLPGFEEGLVSVQDEGAQLAAILLNPTTGMRVLDACAAPGSKSCHLLESAEIELTALDRDRKRTPRIIENLSRLGLSAEILTEDLESSSFDRKFSRILLDAPCSATGVIRRHPDIKLLRKKSDIDKLCAIQRVLLNKAFDLLATGGELLYSTCSILPQENDEVISSILESRSDVSVQPISVPDPYSSIFSTIHGIQLSPTLDLHDGFFYARLQKVTQ